ncbi:hypothetical protein DH2020_046341 [Rehmannia glutinosa]|uniref:RRM domain-containing protein n=1 Tax=Rehmannia glutinosa TaxID=99300 RepID=A0ABR0UBM8_REHGL
MVGISVLMCVVGNRKGELGSDFDLRSVVCVRGGNMIGSCKLIAGGGSIASLPEDLRRPFGQFGPVKDIYLPRDYYTGDPRGFGFVQYVDPADAAEAKYQMDGQILHGRELTVVFAEENRKKPTEMRARERGGRLLYIDWYLAHVENKLYITIPLSFDLLRGRVYDRRQSPPRYSRFSFSRHSPSAPRYGRSHSRSRDYYSPSKRKYSRSISPRDRRYSRERSDSRSPVREQSPPYEGPRNRSGRPVRERSPYGSRSRSQSLGRARSPVRARSPSRSRSRSPYPAEYPRETGRDTSPSR